jgi:hypothetical protein
MATKILVRRDTAANWAAANPVLSQGEPAYEIDTNRTKIGDGVTPYLNLPATSDYAMTSQHNTQWQFRSTTGHKSFTYVTPGHVRTPFRVPANQANTTSQLVVQISTHPDILKSVQVAYDNYNNANGGQPYWYLNGEWYDNISGYDISGDYITVYLNDSYTFAADDIVVFSGWSKGTLADFPSYKSSSFIHCSNPAYNGTYWGPTSDTSNTNTLTIDLNYANNDMLTALTTSQKNFLVIDPYYNNDGRRIVSANLVSGTTYSITFDGAPVSLKAKSTKVLSVKLAENVSNDTRIAISSKEYPDLLHYLQDGNGFITINGGSPINIDYFWPRGSVDDWYGGIDYHGNFTPILAENITATVQDVIEFHYTDHGSFLRFDYYQPHSTLNGNDLNSSSNEGYRWFSWEEDLPYFKGAAGNGVQGGWIDYHVQATWKNNERTDGRDNRTFSVFFDPKGPGYYGNYSYGDAAGLNDYRIQGFPTNSSPANGNIGGESDNQSGSFGTRSSDWDDLAFATLWDFYDDGIFFHAKPGGVNDYISQEVKVDILWNARLFHADVPQAEPNDR